MFRALFCTTLFVTLMVNIIFLFATKDKPPDPTAATPTLVSVIDGQRIVQSAESLAFSSSSSYSSGHVADSSPTGRLFLPINGDFYDSSTAKDDPSRRDMATDDITKDSRQSSQSSLTQRLPGQSDSPTLAIASARVDSARVLARTRRPRAEAAVAADDDKEHVFNVDGGQNHQSGEKANDEQIVPPTTEKSQSAQSRRTKQIRIDNETTRRRRRLITSNATSDTAGPNGRSLARENNKRAPQAPVSETASEIGSGKENKSSRADRELSSEITVITRRPPVGSEPGLNLFSSSTNTIRNANTNTSTSQLLNIRVKSSKSHVLVRVDNLIIYESGKGEDNQLPSESDKHLFKRRHRHVRSSQRGGGGGGGAQGIAKSHEHADDDLHRQRAEGAARGIHVLVLNQFDGRLMAKRLFDTYTPQQDDELVLFLRQIQEGRLLVFALQDEGSFKMARSSQARKLLRRLGSQRIMELGWRDMWALVTIKHIDDSPECARNGRQVATATALAEGLSKSPGFSEWAKPVEIEAALKLKPADSETICAYESDSLAVRARRRAFCSRVEGYGRVCDCEYPAQLTFVSTPIEHTQLWDVPIVVLASNRPYYLYRMLRSLLSADGVDSRMITVFIDGFYDEPKWLCQLMNVRYQQHAPRGTRSARISHHYKTSLAMIFEQLFPQAKMAILFEEDLDVARDALVYFNHTRPLLERDPSLYCASAWNDQGYERSVGAPGGLLRIETMPGLGWMLTRQLFIEELEPRWPPHTQQHDWDMWIRTQAVRRGRECVIPDVSRTYHFGSTGTNINSYFQRQYFAKHAFSGYDPVVQNDPQSIRFDDIATLERDNYEQMLEAKLDPRGSSQQVILGANTIASPGHGDGTTIATMSEEALCSYNSYEDKSYNSTKNASSSNEKTQWFATNDIGGQLNSTQIVIYIKMIDSEDFKNWLHLAKCWRLWDLDARGQHKAMWRLYLKGRQTFVIGVPTSPYAKFMPPQLLPYDF